MWSWLCPLDEYAPGFYMLIYNNIDQQNVEQEPVVYLNGQSFTPRLPDKMNENMEFPGISGDDIEWLQSSFVQAIKVNKNVSGLYVTYSILNFQRIKWKK